MILDRAGNKADIAQKIQYYFPPHNAYIEPFFGAGGMFFNKPKVKFNFLNDNDHDVFNLFRCVVERKDELVEWIVRTPIIEKQFYEWHRGKREDDPIIACVRFLFLSNMGLYGNSRTMRIGCNNIKENILKGIEHTFKYLNNCFFMNGDFRSFFKKIQQQENKSKMLIYADPPYLDTANNYGSTWGEKDSNDLFDTLQSTDLMFAMSEFNNPFIVEQANDRKLNIITIGERSNIKNRRVEILITNFNNHLKLF